MYKLMFLSPLSYCHRCVIGQREGGDPERFNGNSLAAMDGTGPMGNAIVLSFPRRGLPASPGGIGRTGPGKENVRGISSRGLSEGVSS